MGRWRLPTVVAESVGLAGSTDLGAGEVAVCVVDARVSATTGVKCLEDEEHHAPRTTFRRSRNPRRMRKTPWKALRTMLSRREDRLPDAHLRIATG